MTDPDVHETLAHHAQLLAENAQNWEEQRIVNNEHRELIGELQASDERILHILGSEVPKHFFDLRSHIDTQINGILRDAIRATPADAAERQVQATRIGNRWLAMAGIAAMVAAGTGIVAMIVTIASHVVR